MKKLKISIKKLLIFQNVFIKLATHRNFHFFLYFNSNAFFSITKIHIFLAKFLDASKYNK